MLYVSLDIETTGLDPERHQILQIGAIVEDTNNPFQLEFDEIPKFERLIRHKTIVGEPYALNMNAGLIAKLAESELYGISAEAAVLDLYEWLLGHLGIPLNGKIRLSWAGANLLDFDMRFLEKVSNWNTYFDRPGRVLDPSMIYIDWKSDTRPPSLQTCLNRGGILKNVKHDALEDAWDVICLLRKAYRNENT